MLGCFPTQSILRHKVDGENVTSDITMEINMTKIE